MASLQAKQSPIVRFMYSNHYQLPTPPPPLPNFQAPRHSLPEVNHGGSHIKIVEPEASERRERRHRIFEEAGDMKRRSLSHQNGSFHLDQKQPQLQDKINHLLFSSAKADHPASPADSPQPVTRIQPPPEPQPYLLYKNNRPPPLADLPNSSSKPIDPHFTNVTQATPRCSHNEQLRLTRELLVREQEISYLKLELQRYKRCETLSRQNERIYRRLVDKINQHSQREGDTSRHGHNDSTLKSDAKAQKEPTKEQPAWKETKDTERRFLPSETTRFMHPEESTNGPIPNLFQVETVPLKHKDPPQEPHHSTDQDQTSAEFKYPSSIHGQNAVTFHKQAIQQQRNASSSKKQRAVDPRLSRNSRHKNEEIPLEKKLGELNRQLETRCQDYAASRRTHRQGNSLVSADRNHSFSVHNSTALKLLLL